MQQAPLVPRPPPNQPAKSVCECATLAESVAELESDIAHVCRLSCWLVVHISRAETAAGRLVLPWKNHVTQLLDKCWEVMFERCVAGALRAWAQKYLHVSVHSETLIKQQ